MGLHAGGPALPHPLSYVAASWIGDIQDVASRARDPCAGREYYYYYYRQNKVGGGDRLRWDSCGFRQIFICNNYLMIDKFVNFFSFIFS